MMAPAKIISIVPLAYLFYFLLVNPLAFCGQRMNPHTGKLDFCLTYEEADGNPSMKGCQRLLLSNGTLTDNADGTATVTIPTLPVSVANGGTNATSFTSGSILFFDGTRFAQNNANLFWDNTNARLGIGTTAPTNQIHVRTGAAVNASILIEDTASYARLSLQSDAAGGTSWNLMSGYPNAGDFNIREDSLADYFTIKRTTGNVGIGTTSPSRLLHVAGRMQLGGTAIATTDWALTSGWGANATISAVTGTDSRGTVTVTTSALDTPSANPVITLTFKDGTWTSTPFAVANMDHASTGPTTVPVTSQTSATTLIISYRGTPTATSALTYKVNYLVLG